ncbi:glycosyltransferase [Mucilaginibacter aquatilis]|uniref:Glycosyltransferase n=1 Tax=Mucilaginibacter aquatilis TaxID=1517760 RepID=A0A6I4IHB3_9SPHI|nr:glycosyltransferase [Mucilaginibacter aquatilis]MVN93008.1 glycosyltransferase [Mucilaginibacter aquatilis]
MNILLVSGPGISLKEPYNSGIEAFMVSLANQLIDEGHNVDIVAEEADADAKFTLVNPFSASTSKQFEYNNIAEEKSQFERLSTDKYDVVHYNMFYPHLITAGLKFNKPLFLTLHSPADDKRVSAYQELAQCGNITFIAISERVKQQWDYALGLDIPLISNGIDINLWPANGKRGGKYLLWSARINEEKNVAAAISLAIYMQLPLIIAGRITDQHYFDEMVKPHLNSQIQYVGHVTQRELRSLAKNAIAYLATATWQEPFGLAALEMLASGVPVVGFTTAVPPNWKHESVLTIAPPRWQDLAELVEQSQIINSDTCRVFASNMNVKSMTVEYLDLYKKVLLNETVFMEDIFTDSCIMQIASEQPQSSN